MCVLPLKPVLNLRTEDFLLNKHNLSSFYPNSGWEIGQLMHLIHVWNNPKQEQIKNQILL